MRLVSNISFFVLLAVVLGGVSTVRADRLWGNGSISYQHLKRTNDSTRQDDVTQESLILSYEDALFTKNTLRLTANLQRRDYAFSEYSDFQPIFYADLKSLGYAINARYSPYRRRSLAAGTGEVLDIYYRDWRVSTAINYAGYPAFNVIYSRLRTYDNQAVKRYDGFNSTFVTEGSYQYRFLSLGSSYTALQRTSNLPGGLDALTTTYSGNVAMSKSLRKLGYLSTTYNYYDTRQETDDIRTQSSRTHSVTSMLSGSPIEQIGMNASYSGRFTRSKQRLSEADSDDQNFAARIDYSPFTYLTFYGSKGYQISTAIGGNAITEYVTMGASVTRYVREGVDTRLTANRTIFQQSQRAMPVRDTAGNITATVNNGDYSLDTYNASFNFAPRPYFKTYLDINLSHNGDPIDESRRYQLTRSADLRVTFSRAIEGRLTFTALYQGDKLSLGKAFSESYNTGLTYIPWSSMNVNLAYIHTSFYGAAQSSNSSFTGYASYSFRRAFNFYVSYNRRIDTRGRLVPGATEQEDITVTPQNVSGQILIYLSRTATLSTTYQYSRSDNVGGFKSTDETVQTVLTIQL